MTHFGALQSQLATTNIRSPLAGTVTTAQGCSSYGATICPVGAELWLQIMDQTILKLHQNRQLFVLRLA
jgi:hypothetical protein